MDVFLICKLLGAERGLVYGAGMDVREGRVERQEREKDRDRERERIERERERIEKEKDRERHERDRGPENAPVPPSRRDLR